MGYTPTPDLRWGTPHKCEQTENITWGTPHHQYLVGVSSWDGVPPPSIPGLGTPYPGMGYLPTIKTWMGYPPPWDGVPPQTWDGIPPRPGIEYPPLPPTRQSSIASTCYATSGVPLAFPQEDFIVRSFFKFVNSVTIITNGQSWQYTIKVALIASFLQQKGISSVSGISYAIFLFYQFSN